MFRRHERVREDLIQRVGERHNVGERRYADLRVGRRRPAYELDYGHDAQAVRNGVHELPCAGVGTVDAAGVVR